MDWSDERYVRIYVRDTKTWKVLGWEAHAVLCLLARRFDRAGLIDDVKTGEDVAIMIGYGFPEDVAERGLSRLLEKKVLKIVENGLLWPKFMEAQESTASDKQRQRECRARRRDKAKLSQNVTKTTDSVTSGHKVSQPVTPCCTVPNRTVPSCTSEESAPARASKLKRKTKTILPDDWEPTPRHKEIAIEQGVNLEAQAELFRDHWKANGDVKADWDATFRNWLRRARDFSRGRQGHAHQQGTIDFLKRKMEGE